MTLEQRIIAFASAVGADIKLLKQNDGDLSSLSTASKNNLVAAINELYSHIVTIESGSVLINDNAGTGATTTTWSADKIVAMLASTSLDIKNSILDGAGAALDTLKELATALGNDPNFATTIANELGNRVRFDTTQSLTAEQQQQARTNIGAAAQADLNTLTTNLGNIDQDFVVSYNTAKA